MMYLMKERDEWRERAHKAEVELAATKDALVTLRKELAVENLEKRLLFARAKEAEAKRMGVQNKQGGLVLSEGFCPGRMEIVAGSPDGGKSVFIPNRETEAKLAEIGKYMRLLDELLDGHDCDCGETGEAGIFPCYLCEVKAIVDRIIEATKGQK